MKEVHRPTSSKLLWQNGGTPLVIHDTPQAKDIDQLMVGKCKFVPLNPRHSATGSIFHVQIKLFQNFLCWLSVPCFWTGRIQLQKPEFIQGTRATNEFATQTKGQNPVSVFNRTTPGKKAPVLMVVWEPNFSCLHQITQDGAFSSIHWLSWHIISKLYKLYSILLDMKQVQEIPGFLTGYCFFKIPNFTKKLFWTRET